MGNNDQLNFINNTFCCTEVMVSGDQAYVIRERESIRITVGKERLLPEE